MIAAQLKHTLTTI